MEQTFFFITAKSGDYILDNFPTELQYLLTEEFNSRNKIQVNYKGINNIARIGTMNSDNLIVTILTFEKKYIERLKFFNEFLDNSIQFINPILKLEKTIKDKNNGLLQEFIHNVKSLNSYSIQNLYTIIPQKSASENINAHKDQLKQLIKDQPIVTADILLKELKYSIATKVEFSVFENILNKKRSLINERHYIRSVFISVLYLFADDFDLKKIEISLAACEKVLEIDFDSFFVSLYYIFDNAIKYTLPNTKLKINFSEEKDSFDVSIKMVSIKIDKNEIKQLSIRGYRSPTAKKINMNGEGIGMYRVMKTLALNKAEIIIKPNSFNYTKTVKDIDYEGNEFVIKFIGQQDWLK